MIRSRNVLATAALVILGLTATGLVAIPSDGSARSVDYGMAGSPSERIGGAFSFSGEATPGLSAAVAKQARKGDLTPTAQRGTEAQLVTVGFQKGESTTVLVRMPAPRVASR